MLYETGLHPLYSVKWVWGWLAERLSPPLERRHLSRTGNIGGLICQFIRYPTLQGPSLGTSAVLSSHQKLMILNQSSYG